MTKRSDRWFRARAGVWALALLLSACGGGGGGGGGAGGIVFPPGGGNPSPAPAPTPEPTTVQLEVQVSGSGRVRSQPAGIDCADHCTAAFAPGTEVVLTAAPAAGQVLSGWSGACSGTGSTCTVRMDAALTVAAAFAPTPPPVGWGDALALSAAGASLPRVAIDAQGRALLVWRQLEGSTQTDRLYGSRYTPGGGWSTPQRLEANSGSVKDIHVAMDPASGRAMVLWTQLSSSTYDLWAMPVDPGTGWGAPALLENANGIVGESSIGLDAAGNAVAVWSQIGPATRFSAYASRYTAAGGWGSPALIETNEVVGSQDSNPVVAVAPSGEALAVWMRADGSRASLWANRASAAGTWGTAAELVPDAGSAQSIGDHALAFDASGNALLTWGQADLPAGSSTWESSVRAKRYTGGAWQTAIERVGTPVAGSALKPAPVLRVNAAGSAMVAWGQLDGALVAASAAPGAAFGVQRAVQPASSLALTSLPTLGLDDAGHALVAWTQNRSGGGVDLFGAAYDPAGGWGTPALQEDTVELVATPDLASNGRGQGVLGWQQYEAGAGTRIFVRMYASGR